MSEGMSEERLAEIEARANRGCRCDDHECVTEFVQLVDEDVPALLAEVERLRARLDEIGETREEWGVSWPDTSIIDFANSEAEAREWITGYMQMVVPYQPNAAVPVVKRRTAISSRSQWREVPDA